MNEIIPNLFVATFTAAKAHAPEDAFIVNCTKDLPMVRSDGIRISVDDDGSKECMDGMFMVLPNAVNQIHERLSKGQTVVVHCLAGQQRSPTVICAYLMAKEGYALEEAVVYVRKKREEAFFWAVNFRDALEHFAWSL